MPSPIGHCLAGLSVAWSVHPLGPIQRSSASMRRRLVMACAMVAVVPDLDLLVPFIPYFGLHRGPSHSLGAALAVAVIAGVLAVRTSRSGQRRLRAASAVAIGVTTGLAYASHVLLDWLGRDQSTPGGLMVWWPWSSAFFKSGADVFFAIERRYWMTDAFVFGNLQAIAWELVVLLPVVGVAYWLGVRRSTEQ